uniref:Putative ovule protein n=1 Tax=Solanum chacoense TaxID=4108 RepID=A0A0V0INM1_SOLCH
MGSIYSNLSIYIKSALIFYGKEIIQSLHIDLKIYHNRSKSLADYITLIMGRIIINNLRKIKPYPNSKANLNK